MHALYSARPVPPPRPTVTVLAGIALVVEVIRIRQYPALDIWPLVLLAWPGYFAGALFVIVGVRSLIGLWSMPDLPMVPTRRTIVGLLLVTALAASTHADQPTYWLMGDINVRGRHADTTGMLVRLFALVVVLGLSGSATAHAYESPVAYSAVSNNPADALAELPIEDSVYDPATKCSARPKPGMTALVTWLTRNAAGDLLGHVPL